MSGWVARKTSDSKYDYEPTFLSLPRLGLTPATPTAARQSVALTGHAREVRNNRGENLSPEVVDRFDDGPSSAPGFHRSGNLPEELLVPN